ncbi:MAG: hypothetical protein JWM80_77 [Cyanobacteria bacterium RYN_339]|nr:hypothetical protein [Cyanobacteria bacterium RYN_339]
MTKRLQTAPEDEYPAAHTLFRVMFFGAVLLVGAVILGFVGLRVDPLFMKWLHF